jgi:hypothetical protein
MGFRIEAPKQDGNARFNTLKVNLNENNLATRVVVVDGDGNFYYGSGGGGGTGGTNGTSGTDGTSGINGTSGTSGTGFNTIANPLKGRVLLSDGTTNNASASVNLFYDTGSSTLQVTGSLVTDNLIVNADVFEFTGSVRVDGGITGSLLGTASWAYNALTASSADDFYIRADKFEFTGSLEVNGGITGSLLGTSSFAITASHALNVVGTASWAFNALTASSADDFYIRADKFEFTGSLEVDGGITGSLLGTASYAITASHALNVVGTASWAYNALTASSADDFYIRADKFEFTGSLEVNGGITGSLLGTASYAITASHALNVVGTASWAYNALTASSADDFLVRGTLTAQTIVAQVITSSTQYITGSTIFGSQLSNTHQFTGSVSITGSLTANDLTVLADVFEFTGSVRVDGGITGSLLGTASFAVTASHALNVLGTASWAFNALTASSADDFYIRADVFEFTGSLRVQGGITGSLYGTSSWAVSASWSPGSAQSDTASYVSSSNVYGPYGFDSIRTASFAFTASSADDFTIRADKFEFTGSLEVLGGITGSLLGTASYAPNIYNSDGELTSNRSISASLYNLTINSLKSTGSTFIVSHLQTQSNATDTADIGMQVTYNISASSATNQLVSRAFQLSVSNNLTGGGALQNLRCFNLAAFFASGSTTTEADLVYLERGNLTGTISTYRAIRIANYTGTQRAGIVMAAIGATNAVYLNLGSVAIPSGRWGVYQSETAISNYFAGNFSIGTTQTGSYKLHVIGNTGISGSLAATGSIFFPSLTQSPETSVVLLNASTGQLYYTSSAALIPLTASYALTASQALTASSADDFYIRADVFEFTGSLRVNGSITGSLFGTSSWAVSASWAPSSTQSDTASYVSSSNVYGPYGFDSIRTASFAFTASSADDFTIRADVFEFTGSVRVNGGITGSLLGTASFATTASYALNAGSAFPFSGSAVITGSLLISGSSSSTTYLLNASGTSKLTTIHVENLKNSTIGANGQIDVFVVNNPGDAGYQKLSILAGGSPYSTVLRTSGDGGGSRGMILDASGPGGEMYFGTSNANRWLISGTYNASGSGHIFPIGDNLYDIGNPTAKVANYYGVRSYISNLLSVTGSVNSTGSFSHTGVFSLQRRSGGSRQIVITSEGENASNISTANYLISIGPFSGLNLTGSGANSMIAIGVSSAYSITTGGSNSIYIGRNSGRGITTGASNIIICSGDQTDIRSNTENSIHILAGSGYELNNAGLTLGSLVSKYVVIGGGYNAASYINDFYFGAGPFISTPASANLNFYAPSATGSTDQQGTNFTINAGRGTGAGTPGDFIIATSTAGSSGIQNQTLSNRVWIKGNTGNVGIGISNPTSTIHISGSSNSTLGLRVENANFSNTDAFSSFQAGSSVANNRFINVGFAGQGVVLQGAYRPTGSFIVSNGNGGLNFLATGSGNNAHIRFFTSATSVGGTERVIILDSGNVGIGTSTPAYPLDVNGTARVTALIETSTRTLKENIQSYSTDLDKFKKLNPVLFNWKDTKKEDIGLIAEELEDLFPEFVSKDDTGNPIGIQYGKLGIIFINVIKEQQKRIEILENQVKKLIK